MSDISSIPIAVRPRVVTAYKCPHAGCRKPAMVTLKSAIKHAQNCIHDPAQRTCATCTFDDKEDGDCLASMRERGQKFARGCPEWAQSLA